MTVVNTDIFSYQLSAVNLAARGADGWSRKLTAETALPGMYDPHRRTQAEIEGFLARHFAVAFFIDQVIRPAGGGCDLEHVQLAAHTVLFDRIGAAFENGDLGFERGIEFEAGRRRGRIGNRLQIARPVRAQRGQRDA